MSEFIPPGFVKIEDFVEQQGSDVAREKLYLGEFKAFFYSQSSGELDAIAQQSWGGAKAEEWLNHGWVGLHFIPSETGFRYVLNRSIIVQEIPTPALAGARSKGGRPPKHDWASLAAYCVHYIVENDYPDTQTEMVRIAMDWFTASGSECPDEREVQRFVQRIYASRRTGKL